MLNMSTSQTAAGLPAPLEDPTPRTKVLVLYGGRSGEHSISCITASGVMAAIDRDRYEVIPVGITRGGKWVLGGNDPGSQTDGQDALPRVLDNGSEVLFPLTVGNNELRVIEDGAVRSLGTFDVVFPLLHGPFGEDGTLQGLLELADTPYVGAGVFASAAGMDKHYMKLVFAGHDLPISPFVTVLPGQWETRREDIISKVQELSMPVFVKPARAGSSLGISRVTDLAMLDDAISFAAVQDPKIIIEQGLNGREIECAVLGGRDGGLTRTSLPGEIVVTSQNHEFYDFEAKYLSAQSAELSCPADLPASTIARVQELAVQAFNAIGAEGLSRVDVFVEPNGDVIINEINTMPGFTPVSMYPRMWERSGLAYTDLLTELIELALERPVGLR